jgi:outer membrane protein OmpA-like peptidoglycan-associated protein
VLGHADDGGGASANVRLAARRAGAVATELARRGVERDRIRGEARAAAFSRRVQAHPGRNALIVVLPPAE